MSEPYQHAWGWSTDTVTEIARQRDFMVRHALKKIPPGLWPFASVIQGPGHSIGFEYDSENHMVVSTSSERIKVVVTG